MNSHGWTVSVLRARARMILIGALLRCPLPVFGAAQESARPLAELAKAAIDRNGKIRSEALSALVRLEPKKGVEPIVTALRDNPRAESDYLGAMSAIGQKAVPILLDLMKRPELRPYASRMLYYAVPPDSPKNVAPLLGCLQEADVAGDCGQAFIKSCGPRTAGKTPLLVKALSDKRAYVRAHAAAALGLVGKKTAATALAKAAKDREPQVRMAAVRALGLIGDRGPDTVAVVEAEQSDSDGEVRRVAKEALAKLR